MEKNGLKVIRGGMTSRALPENRRFVSAYITDTRLLGVMVLHIHWIYDRKQPDPDFHQFFYIDCEETGIESYESLFTVKLKGAGAVFKRLSDGLGGKKHIINEAQARYVLKEFAAFNERTETELPKGLSEYRFLLEEESCIKEKDIDNLFFKECDRIVTENQALNYFLMRGFGMDEKAFSYLVTDSAECGEMFRDVRGFLMHRNKISPTSDENVFMCESLIEKNGKYSVMVSGITLDGLKICAAERKSIYRISDAEVHMILSRSEFVSHFVINISRSEFEKALPLKGLKYVVNVYDSGKVYTVYDSDNANVRSSEFLLYNDVKGFFFVSRADELLVVSGSEEQITELERRFERNMLDGMISIDGKYEFQEPVMYTFILSDLDSFYEFIELITQ